MPPGTEPNPTQERLLDAAVALFAGQGYRKTTVREIVDAAGANLGAVNYHFGGKEQLYQAAMDHARHQSNRANALVQADTARDFHQHEPPERRLYLFVRTLLEHMFRDGQPSAMTRLMQQEIMHPTAALDRLVEQSVRRVQAALRDIVASLMPTGVTERQVQHAAMSVTGQVHCYHLMLPFIQRLHPDQAFAPADLDEIAQHITAFSAAALRATPT